MVPTLPFAGAALVMVGATVAAVMVMVSACVAVPPALVAVMLAVKVPDAEGEPVIWPVLAVTMSAGGKPLAPKLVGMLVAVI